MKKLEINSSSHKYNIFIGHNSLKELNFYKQGYDKILLLSNSTVGPLYKDLVLNFLDDNSFYFEIEDGESFKNIETCEKIYTFLIENNFSRKSLIICLGGGVVCDLGGFIAATFMRGIDFLQIPTSLLSQVDASIGGKVAINHPLGKNLIGAFKQPVGVLIDLNFLKTLPKEEFLSGMGEIIKHGILKSHTPYLEFLKNNASKILSLDDKILEEMIYVSCTIKKSFVETDEFEKGCRAFLNLGHTYAHALETIFNFKNITHGNAVAKGIIFELYLAHILNKISIKEINRFEEIFSYFEIDSTPIYIESNRLIEVMKKDKKNHDDSINFIIFDGRSFENISIDKENINIANNFFKERFLKGVIDIGTNSCRIFVAEVENKNEELKIIKPLFKDLDISRLGKGLIKTNQLSDESMEKTIEILKRFKKILDGFGVSKTLSFATSATREASNGDYFIEKIKDLVGLSINIIPGDLEAKLCFNSCLSLSDKKIVSIDIGGGSTEITFGDKNNIYFLKSFPIGVVKLTEMFFKNQNYNFKNIEDSKQYLKEFFKELSSFSKEDFEVIGVAGSVTTNVTVLKKMNSFIEEKVHNTILTIEDLTKNLELFLTTSRDNIIGLEKNRADVIISGNIMLIELLKLLNKNYIKVSTKDNLEGAMCSHI